MNEIHSLVDAPRIFHLHPPKRSFSSSSSSSNDSMRDNFSHAWEFLGPRDISLLPPLTIPTLGATSSDGPSPSLFPRFGNAVHAFAARSSPGQGRKPTASVSDLFLFGGLAYGQARNDLYRFNVRELSATLLETAGDKPSPRIGHACSHLANVFVMWGGNTKTDTQIISMTMFGIS